MLARFLSLLLVLVAAGQAAAQSYYVENGALVVVSTGYDASATSIVLQSGHGARLGSNFPQTCVWWNDTDYPGGRNASYAFDPNFEQITVTARSTDTLTVTRAGSPSTHNTAGKTYVINCGVTRAFVDDLRTGLGASFVTLATNATTANERVLTGTSNQITVTDNGAGSTVVLSTPQNIHTSATPQFAALGIGAAASGPTGSINGVSDELRFYPTNTSGGVALLKQENNPIEPGGGTDKHETDWYLYGRRDSVTNYFTGAVSFGAWDGTNFGSAHSVLSEGNWTNAGGFSLSRFAIFDHQLGTELLMHQSSNSGIVYMGRNTADKGMSLYVYGKDVDTDADQSTGGLRVDGDYVKDDANTRAFSHVKIYPTFNFGSVTPNANTTVTILDVDSNNTSTTGATINLQKWSDGGTQRAVMTKAGRLRLGAGTALHQFEHISGDSDFSNSTTFGDGGTQKAAHVVNVDFTDSLSGNVRAAVFDAAYNPAAATNKTFGAVFGIASIPANSQTLSTTDVRGLNGIGYSASTGTVREVTGGYYVAQHASTGTTTTLAGLKVLVGGTSGSGTATSAYGLKLDNIVNSGTFSNTYGVYIGDVTAGTQTNQAYALYAEDTGARSYFGHSVSIGGTANRGTTEGTNQLKLFNGTAPVGTLTNGGSLYAEGGELKVMDSGGTATTISPHDDETGEWIMYSENTVTGRRFRVDMERLVKRLDAMLGGGFVTEFIDPGYHNSTGAAQGRVIFSRMPWAPYVAPVAQVH